MAFIMFLKTLKDTGMPLEEMKNSCRMGASGTVGRKTRITRPSLF
ncbi:hypothetical protein DMO16_21405 [Fictibacillus sp. S7]|nr:hypothetical protein DMO16_21405 [Fictibacillus sp. S7]